MDMPEAAAAGATVEAVDLGLKGPRGQVFRGVRVKAPPGSLIAIEGPSGSGRTCLLLTLTGRMKPSEGRATVGGHHLPKGMSAVRRISAVANVSGVTDLEPALTVGEHLRERALLERRFGDSLRALLRPRRERAAAARQRIDAALTAAGLDQDALPKGPCTALRDLERLEALRLSVALALISRPRLLAVDDADLKLSAGERAEVWALLRSVAETGTTVLAVCAEAPQDAMVVSTTPGPQVPRDGDVHPPDGERGAQDAPLEAATPEEPSGDTPEEATTPEEPSEDGADDDKETADALAETGRA
ncbi:ATP-binding cassette domain-containing protein [Streptomyces sp. NPDC047079]|uniref:ATP-binding cassette domain-containing protein n=1 Tax=Streptomyces sp. NPDC047079 TaxID=3154607 RepID=UPI003406F5DC